MDPVKSWMDVEEIRRMAADLLKEPADLDVLKEEVADNPVSGGKSEVRERALKAISEAANRLKENKDKQKGASLLSDSSTDEAQQKQSSEIDEATKPISPIETEPPVASNTEIPSPKKPAMMVPQPIKSAIPNSVPVEELLKSTGDTAPVDLRTPVVSKTKLPSKTQLTRVIEAAKAGAPNRNLSEDYDFRPFVTILSDDFGAEGVFIFDRDDDLYYDSIENEKFLEVSRSLITKEITQMPKSLYLRLGAKRFLQLVKIDGNRGLFVVGVLLNTLIEDSGQEKLREEFLKHTDSQ